MERFDTLDEGLIAIGKDGRTDPTLEKLDKMIARFDAIDDRLVKLDKKVHLIGVKTLEAEKNHAALLKILNDDLHPLVREAAAMGAKTGLESELG